MAEETLERLYKSQPEAKKVISKSAGYGVFSNFGMKIFVTGSGKGKGIVFDNKTKPQNFMKMFELQAGLCLGVKNLGSSGCSKIVKTWMILSTRDGSSAIRPRPPQKWVTRGAFAGAISVSPGVWLYLLTDEGRPGNPPMGVPKILKMKI